MKKEDKNRTEKEKGCDYFASTLKGAGPLMQKMMQGVPDRMVIPELSGALATVKSSLAPIDSAYVDQVFEEMIRDSNNQITQITDRRSLGAASVAETFFCRLHGPKLDQEVVVKILRPDAKEKMKKEFNFIRKAAMYADMTDKEIDDYEKKHGNKMVSHNIKVTESGFLAQFGEIQKEFNFLNEVQNCKLGTDNYVKKYSQEEGKKNNYHVKSVVINETVAPKAHYIVMDKANGVTVDKIIENGNKDRKTVISGFRNTNPATRSRYALNSANVGNFWKQRNQLHADLYKTYKTELLLSKLAFVWIEQALYGSSLLSKNGNNFHHGDMHAGNIMVDDHNSTILDYGNAVLLSDKKVNQILSMMSAVVINRADFFVEAFDNMLAISADEEKDAKQKVGYQRLSEETRQSFIKKLDELFKLGGAEDSGKKIIIALNVAQELGVKLPKEIQNFSQCEQRLENTLLETKQSAIRLCDTIRLLDTMPVSKEDADSFDPLIRLHEKLRNLEENEKEKVITEYKERFKRREAAYAMSDVTKIASDKQAKEFIQKYIPEYMAVRELDAGDLEKKVKQWRGIFEEMLKHREKGEATPQKIRQGLSECYGDILLLVDEQKGILQFMSEETLLECGARAFQPMNDDFDEYSFERIMAVFEKQIPAVIKAGKAAEKCGKTTTLKEEEKREIQIEASDAAGNACISYSTAKPEAVELSIAMHKAKASGNMKDLERRLAGVLQRDYGIRQSFKAWQQDEKKEDMFLEMFILNSYSDLEGAERYFAENGDPEAVRDNDKLPDFVTVMGKCVRSHLVRSIGKLNSGIAKEVKRLDDEEKKMDKAIDKEEKEAQKKEEERLKAEKKKQEEEAKMLEKQKKEEEKQKKLEEERKKKEEEKRKKEEEKRKKEEAKRLEKQKKEEEKRKKEEAKKKKKK
ncbi:MAG: hypothetical protein K5697_06855 [Lachnospiraceae bacterium]|nr:hypothetical protein [Lachnospiraceae bacterium]